MKELKVAAAIIELDGRIMIAQRDHGEHKGLWEFPGGKFEENENGRQTIVREIREEFEAEVCVDSYLCTIEHDYDSFHLIMECFICHLNSYDLKLHDHSGIRFIDPDEEGIDWVPADRKVIEAYRKRRKDGQI